jgi:hypothetical protein
LLAEAFRRAALSADLSLLPGDVLSLLDFGPAQKLLEEWSSSIRASRFQTHV